MGEANVDNLIGAVRGLELSVGRLGSMLQAQGQQTTATLGFLSNLEKLLNHLVGGTVANRERLEALSIILEARLPSIVREDAPDAPPAPPEPVVLVRPVAALANRMIQHMVALSIKADVPGASIPVVDLPEWGRDEAEAFDVPEPDLEIDTMRVDVGAIAARMRRGDLRTVELSGYVQNIDNFLDPDIYRSVFVGPNDVLGYGPKVLLISLRMDEVLSGDHPPYVLLPVSFYRELVGQTGLKPVFFGQLTPSPYLDALKAAFPDARFVPGRNPVHDFETIRRSRNIVVSVSTFSWLAAWLSNAERVFLPLAGLFNPMFGATYGHGHNLVPRDQRYRLFLFPLGVAVPPDELPAYHRAIDGMWCEVAAAEIDDRLDGRRLAARSLANHLALFDEKFYLARYPEIGAAIEAGTVRSARLHYETLGFLEGRTPFDIDLHYAIRHPQAGLAISNGEFTDLHHFHAERGHALGYDALAPFRSR